MHFSAGNGANSEGFVTIRAMFLRCVAENGRFPGFGREMLDPTISDMLKVGRAGL